MTAPSSSNGPQVRNYWQLALDSLSPDLKANINLASTSRRDILEAVLQVSEEKRTLCMKKRWRFKRSNGEEIILRNVFEKISRWIDRFKAVGDTAVQFDPSPASLAWAAVRFLLQATVNDVEIFGAMAENLETISRLIAQYREFEQLHLQQSSAVSSLLEDSLTRMYAAILVFLAKAVHYYQDSTVIRISKSPFRIVENQEIVKVLTQEKEVLKLAGFTDTERLLSLQTVMVRLSDQATISEKALEESRYRELLNWLSPTRFSHHHADYSENRLAGTGQWLLDHPEYCQWRASSSSSILLLHGIPGCGKSMLSSMVVDSLLSERAANPTAAPFAYFYCADYEAEPERGQPDKILRSIVRQLAVSAQPQRKVRDAVLSEYERRRAEAELDGFEAKTLQAKDCVRLILDVTNSDPVTIVLDAVDEVKEQDRYELLHALSRVVSSSNNVTKVLMTSRDNSHIHAILPDARKLRISKEGNRADVDCFVRAQINGVTEAKRLLNGRVPSSLCDELVDKLVEGAGEMFLWAKLQIEYLCRMMHEKDVANAIRELSLATLDEIYTDILRKVLESEQIARDIAIRVFSWLLFTKEPLKPEAIISAISLAAVNNGVEVTLSDIVDVCFNLVIVDAKDTMLRFAHQSAQEFLRSQAIFAEPCAQQLLASSCLRVCMQGPPHHNNSTPLLGGTFYRYGAMYWAEHYRSAGVTEQDALFCQMMNFIYDDDDVSLSFMSWLDYAQKFSNDLARDHPQKPVLDTVNSSDSSPLFTACIFGLECLLDQIVARSATSPDWNQMNLIGQTGVYLAAARGHDAVVSYLIQQGADVNIHCGRYGSALNAACFAGHGATVQCLLHQGASIRSSGIFSNSLDAAFCGMHESVAIIVLESGYIRSQDDYDSALLGAAQTGFIRVVEWLQRPKLVSLYGKTAADKMLTKMTKAIAGGQLGVLRYFMNKSSDPLKLLPHDGIATAALHGRGETVNFLLDNGLDVEAEGLFGPPLRVASLMNHDHIVRILLGRGAKVNACGPLGDAIQAAALKGHTQIVRLLLDEGACPNQSGGFYGTALQAAAYHGQKSTAEMLLKAGAHVRQRGFMKDAFHAAASGGHQELILLFLENGFKLHDTRCVRSSFLKSVSTNKKYKDLLREASPSRRGRHGKERSLHSAKRPPISEVHSILKAERDTNTASGCATQLHAPSRDRDPDENYALEAGACAGHDSVVKFLLQQQKALRIEESEVSAAIQGAAQNGHVNVLEVILQHREFTIHEVRKALKLATGNGHVDAVDMLLQYATARDQTGDVLDEIFTTGCSRNSSLVKKALDLASPNCSTVDLNSMKEKVLQDAAKNKAPDIINYILESDALIREKVMLEAFLETCRSGHMPSLLAFVPGSGRHSLMREDLDKGLNASAAKGHGDLVRHLLTRSSQPEESVLKECIISATGNGHLDVAQLLASKIRTFESSRKIFTRALITSSENGHTQVTAWLIQEGADVNAIVSEVPTAQSDLERLLFRRQKKEQGKTISALQACLRGFIRFHRTGSILYPAEETQANAAHQKATLRLLLEHGADVNALGGQQRNPITQAANHCSPRILDLLIRAGADVNSGNGNDLAVDVVVKRELMSATILQRLLDAGAFLRPIDNGIHPLLNQSLSFFVDHSTQRHLYGTGASNGGFVVTKNLHDVFAKGPGAVIRILLSRLPGQRADDERYGLVLQMAAFLNDIDYVKLLIQRGIDVNSVGNYYGTALQAASRSGHVAMVRLLLRSGADVNILQGRYHTALRAAIVGAHTEVVELLIEQGANIKLKGERECYQEKPPSALQLAVENQHTQAVRLLLAAGADAKEDNPDRQHPLLIACGTGDIEIIQMLLAAGAPINVTGKEDNHSSFWGENASPLHKACRKGHLKVVQILLEQDADAEKVVDGLPTPLIVATEAGNLQIVRVLLAEGVNIDQVAGGTALSRASYYGNVDIVKELLRFNATVWAPQRIPNALLSASSRGNLTVMEILLERLCKSGLEDHQLLAAVEEASIGADERVLRLLLAYGSFNSNAKIFIEACASGSQSAANMMLQGVSRVDDEDDRGRRALHVAAFHLHFPVVETLVSHGANLNFVHPFYGSPIIAALEGLAELSLRRFLEHYRSSQDAGGLQPTYTYNSGSYQKEIEGERTVVGESQKSSMGEGEKSERRETESKQQSEERNKPAIASKWLTERIFEPSRLSDKGISYERLARSEQIVQFLIASGADPETELTTFGNALHIASFIGSETTVQLLLEKGVCANTIGGLFETPLFAALMGRHESIVELLLRHGADVHHISSKHGTPLHYACSNLGANAARVLLQYGSDVNRKDNQGRSSLTAVLERSESIPRKSNPYSKSDKGAILHMLMDSTRKLEITQKDLIAAVTERFFRSPKSTLQLILEYDKNIVVSEDVIVAAVENHLLYVDKIHALLERNGGAGVTETMLKRARGNSEIKALLNHKPICKITLEILQAQREQDSMKTLLEYDKTILPTEALVISALRAGDRLSIRTPETGDGILEVLWERDTKLRVSEEMLKAAQNPRDLQFLLAKRQSSSPISIDVLRAARNSKTNDCKMLLLLLKYDTTAEVPSEIVLPALDSLQKLDILQVMLERDPATPITEEMFLRLFGARSSYAQEKSRKRLIEVLQGAGITLVFTKKIREAVDRAYWDSSQAEMKGKFYSLEKVKI